MATYAIIMAGGTGTRFWPASRRTRPKQLLALAPGDERSLLRATAERLASIVAPERLYVVTSETLAMATAAELPQLPASNILVEPAGRNTAPCVGWAAAVIRRSDPDAVLMVLPADHHISDGERFTSMLAEGVAAASDGNLVTVGIQPTRPETGYGYLEIGREVREGVRIAQRFVEKPNRQRAEQFLASGNFLWNSGMFFFRADTILAAIEQHLPGLHEGLAKIDVAAAEGRETEEVAAVYPTLPSVSLDHGVMEKADEVWVVPGNFGWSDLGSWATAWELGERDAEGNVLTTDTLTEDATGNFVEAPKGKIIALVGVSDLVVVDTEDALLIVPRERAQDVRAIVAQLIAKDDDRA